MSSEKQKILTTDGIPLEVSLKKAEKKNKIKAFLLVCPLLLFLIITYVFPIGDMLYRSVDDRMVTNMLPKTYKAMEQWDGKDLPEEEVFEALHQPCDCEDVHRNVAAFERRDGCKRSLARHLFVLLVGVMRRLVRRRQHGLHRHGLRHATPAIPPSPEAAAR